MFGINKKNKQKKIAQSDSVLQSEDLYQRGVATIKDLIAPAAMKVSSNYIQIGETFARTVFVVAYPRYLHTNWFSPIINIDFSMDTSMFVHPISTVEILKTLRKSSTQVQSQIHMEEQSGKIRDPILETAIQDIENLRDSLQQGTEKFFRFGLYMTIYANSLEEVDKINMQIEALLEAQMVYVKPAVLKVEQVFASALPLANDEIDIANNLN